MTNETELCPHCQIPVEIVREHREVALGKRRVFVHDERSHCPECGEEYYTAAQADQRHARAVDQARREDGLLTPSEIREVRQGLGLSQSQFERLIGAGEKTVVRWENGRVCQNATADRLIRLLAANPANAFTLAGINEFVGEAPTIHVRVARSNAFAIAGLGAVGSAVGSAWPIGGMAGVSAFSLPLPNYDITRVRMDLYGTGEHSLELSDAESIQFVRAANQPIDTVPVSPDSNRFTSRMRGTRAAS